MISFKHTGDLSKTEKFLNYQLSKNPFEILRRYGEEGVRQLSLATPIDSGATANSWYYEITSSRKGHAIVWCNSNEPDGVPLAILLQYGHATGSGGYVLGRDYINPAIRPIFDKIAEEVWKEVTG